MAGSATSAVVLGSACPATLIPSGEKVLLDQGTQVTVTQALGVSITVQTDTGKLARIDAEHARAAGLAEHLAEPSAPVVAADADFHIDQVLDALRTVFDPEIPVNVVDLGLIYGHEAHELADGTHRVDIQMSMTAPGCGMGDVLRDDAHQRVSELPGVSEVHVELVWDPPWSMARMSEAAKLELGIM